MKWSICLFVYLFSAFSASSQYCKGFLFRRGVNVVEDKICNEQLIFDLQYIKQKLEGVHPSLELYCKKKDFDSAYNATLLLLNQPYSIIDFSLLVSDWLSLLKDSHTFLSPKNWDQYKTKGRYNYPFRLTAVEDKLIVAESRKNKIPIGSELISFNSLTIPEIRALSLRMSPVEARAYDAQSEFSVAQLGYVLNSVSQTRRKSISYCLPEKDTLTVVFRPASLFKTRSVKQVRPSKIKPELTISGKTAHLVIKSFAPKSFYKFKVKLRKTFEEIAIKNVDNLIIDLRNNFGGYVGLQEQLMQLISTNTTPFKAEYIYKRSAHDRFSSLSVQQRWRFKQLANRPYSSEALRKELAFFNSPYGTVDTILITTSLRNKSTEAYSGKCTLLINGLSMSAAANFAAWFKSSKRGELVGTPCMGSLSGTFANSSTILLPQTQLTMSISTLKITPLSIDTIDVGCIVPDHVIRATQKQIQHNIDPCLEFLKISQIEK